jgi:hypothetical protein
MTTTEVPVRPAPDPGTSGPPPRTVLLVGGSILLAIAMVAVIAGVVYGRAEPGVNRADHVVSGPLGAHRSATLDLVSGATSVTVRGVPLGDELYRVTTPDNARVVPAVAEVHDIVQVQLANAVGAGPSTVVIELNRGVRWDLRFTAGATSTTVDVRDTAVASVAFIGGVSSIDLTVPRPTGTVPVRMSGGASQFAIHGPSGVPVRVRVGGGAGSATVDGVRHSGLSAGVVLTPDGWDTAIDRYDVDATAGVSTLTVDRW